MPDGVFGFMPGVPSWRKDVYAIEGGVIPFLEGEDPEQTLMVQLTAPEVSLLTFGLTIIERLFPELGPYAGVVSHKISELIEAQEYLSEGGSTTDAGE